MGVTVWYDNQRFDTTNTVSVEYLKDDKMQIVFYTLHHKESINIVPDDYRVTTTILVMEGRIKLQSVNEDYDLKIHDAIMLSDIEQSYYAEAEGFTKLLVISSEANQDPQEDEAISQMLLDVEEKDVYTMGHSKRVSLYAKRLALAYEPTYNVVSLSTAASLHDIGKINIPVSILQKPGALTNEEFTIIKQHPLDSYSILKEKFGERAAVAALQHHERLDGSGYPYGLKGDQICMDARIIAISDVFDALTCKRSYNKPRAPIDVVQYLEENVDQYDATFITILRRKVESGDLDDIITAFVNPNTEQ